LNDLWESLKRLLLQNLLLKLVAFAASLAFFAWVHSQEDIRIKTLPVSLVSLPPVDGNRELMTLIPPNIHVTLRGPTRALNQLVQEGVAPVEIDLRSGARETVEFRQALFALPRDVELLVVDPPRLELTWEDIVTRQIPLQALISGRPSDGFEVRGAPVVEPRTITARGPLSRVEVVQFARLSPYDVSGLTDGFWPRRIAIDPPPSQVRFLGAAATVTVEVARRLEERVFTSVPVQVLGPARGTSLPAVVSVTVKGLPEKVAALTPEQVIARADLLEEKLFDAAHPHGSATVPLRVSLEGMEARTQPPAVAVHY